MRTQKRIIALVLFAVMLFSLAACSKNDPTPSTDNTSAPSTTPVGDATTPSTDASTSDWTGPDWMNQTGMPIVKEGTEKTLSIYVEQTAEYGDFKESWMYKYITEVMNINLDVTVFLSDSKADFAPYQYPFTKAYEMMSCFEGLLEYALTVGSEKWKTAAIRFAYRMVESDITLLGSAGTTHEFLNHAVVHQVETSEGGVGQETCVSVTWMKLCARMLLVTGDPLFGDCFEQTLYNAYLGTLNYEHISNPEKIQGGFRIPGVNVSASFLPFDSYTPLMGGTRGQGIGGSLMFADGTYYGCCACIASVGIGIAPHLAVLRTDNGFAVQLYEKGVYQTQTESGNGVTFHIETDYPVSDTIRIRVEPQAVERFSLSLRIPSWSVENTLLINGQPMTVTPGMTTVDRIWQPGDVLQLRLDLRVEALRPTPYEKDVLRSRIIWKTCDMVPFMTEMGENHRNHVAFRRGPLMLATDARLGNTEDTALVLESDEEYLPAEKKPAAELPFSAICYVQVLLKNGKKLDLIDCASAGRTWKDDSDFAIWMKTEKE